MQELPGQTGAWQREKHTSNRKHVFTEWKTERALYNPVNQNPISHGAVGLRPHRYRQITDMKSLGPPSLSAVKSLDYALSKKYR